jgi:energy-coupling factor transporter ATP-binding protein EcfA2
MIKRLVVEKLYDRFDFDLTFNEDLNLLTGRNGSGKTTLMKIMWGMLSGRIGDEAKYPKFENVLMEVGDVKLFQGKADSPLFPFERQAISDHQYFAGWGTPGKLMGTAQGYSTTILKSEGMNHFFPSTGRTLFFPTFRRNEGGYEFLNVPQPVGQNPLADANLASMVRAANNGPRDFHVFVNYSSTIDIDYIISSLHSQLANKAAELEKAHSEFVTERISRSEGDEKAILHEIKARQDEKNRRVEALMKPIEKLGELVSILYKDKGIAISSSLTLGEKLDPVNSEHLSAGEKQMLSFLAYCSICKNTIIFIDEPELSLHADWQRLFLPMLMEIRNGNQYFMATHSPFVYAMYPDKDIDLDKGKGGA